MGNRKIFCIASLLLVLGVQLVMGLQSAPVPLRLLYVPEGSEEQDQVGKPLPPSTVAAVLRHPSQSYRSLSEASSREDISRRILSHLESGRLIRLSSDSATTQKTFQPTSQSEKVLYVAARTPTGELYESQVRDGQGGRTPGFVIIQTGRITMAPVPDSAQLRMLSTFRVGVGPTGESGESSVSGRRTEENSDSSSDSFVTKERIENAGNRTGEDGYQNVTIFVVAGLVLAGGLAGIGGTWYILSKRLQRARKERDKLKHALRQKKNEAYWEEAGIEISSMADDLNSGGSAASHALAEEHLRRENKRLQKRNEYLKEEIEKIKKHLKDLRDGGDQS